jgi:hypothetical protein
MRGQTRYLGPKEQPPGNSQAKGLRRQANLERGARPSYAHPPKGNRSPL